MPNRKVTAGGLAGAFAVISLWTASRYGVTIPAEVGAAISTVFTFIISYFVREPV